MTQVRTGAQVLATPGYGYVEPDSRVITLLADWRVGGDYFVVSEAIANPFHLKAIWVNAVWMAEDIGPLVDFRITAGVGKQVDWNIVSNWEPILPVRVEAYPEGSWIAIPDCCQFSWTMNRRFTEQGRRLGVSCRQFDDSDVFFYTSFEIAEG